MTIYLVTNVHVLDEFFDEGPDLVVAKVNQKFKNNLTLAHKKVNELSKLFIIYGLQIWDYSPYFVKSHIFEGSNMEEMIEGIRSDFCEFEITEALSGHIDPIKATPEKIECCMLTISASGNFYWTGTIKYTNVAIETTAISIEKIQYGKQIK